MPLTRTVTLDDLTPAEVASAFADWNAEQQAEFLGCVGSWPGSAWCQQSYAISGFIDAKGRDAVRTLASHLCGEGYEL